MTQLNHRIINFFFIIAIVNIVFYSCAPQQQPTCDNVTDIDGNTYQVVKIGDQCWMAENLKVTHYRNGDTIPNITVDSTWKNLVTGAYCNYNNDTVISDTYGRLYNWYAVNDSRNIAPEGWHIPTKAEWQTLENYLGGYNVAGGKLKAWNGYGSNSSGFTALPAGTRFSGNGHFYELDSNAVFWSITECITTAGFEMSLRWDDLQSHLGFDYKAEGNSIRCIKD